MISAYLANDRPIDFETNLGDLRVSGCLPRDLQGSLMRIGPNAHGPSLGAPWLSGAGMLHAFVFNAGRVSYRNRWVRAPGHQPANANVVLHAGRLLALGESCPPVTVEPESLETVGWVEFGGGLTGPSISHPKIDRRTGELVFVGSDSAATPEPALACWGVDSSWRTRHICSFATPRMGMANDFGMTANFLAVPWEPLATSHAASFLGLIHRRTGATRWRSTRQGVAGPLMNAWEDGCLVHVDVIRHAHLHRWSVDLTSEPAEVLDEPLCHIAGDYPRIDERYAGRPHCHAWFVGDASDGSRFARLVHVDHEGGRIDSFTLPPSDCAAEPVFVPRHGQAAEGDGWLLSVVYRGALDCSDVLVLDALNLCDGPHAIVHLPHRIPNGLHGTWVPARS